MSSRKFTSALAILAATAGAAAFAGSAEAAVVDNDFVSANGANVDFNGNVAFDLHDGTMQPVVTGTVGITNGLNTRGRIRIYYYDGSTLLDTVDGDDLVPDTNLLDEWPTVNRSGVSDPLIDRVVVTTEFENAQNVYVQQATTTALVSMHDDDVTVLGAGIDLGAPGPLVGGAPSGPAEMNWSLVDGVVTPTLENEKLHMDNLGGVCGRVKLRFLDAAGTVIDSAASGPRCPADNKRYGFSVNDIPAVSSSLIESVEVQIQTDTGPNGAWNLVNSRTVSLAE